MWCACIECGVELSTFQQSHHVSFLICLHACSMPLSHTIQQRALCMLQHVSKACPVMHHCACHVCFLCLPICLTVYPPLCLPVGLSLCLPLSPSPPPPPCPSPCVSSPCALPLPPPVYVHCALSAGESVVKVCIVRCGRDVSLALLPGLLALTAPVHIMVCAANCIIACIAKVCTQQHVLLQAALLSVHKRYVSTDKTFTALSTITFAPFCRSVTCFSDAHKAAAADKQQTK